VTFFSPSSSTAGGSADSIEHFTGLLGLGWVEQQVINQSRLLDIWKYANSGILPDA
jgi:hypothetical protein